MVYDEDEAVVCFEVFDIGDHPCLRLSSYVAGTSCTGQPNVRINDQKVRDRLVSRQPSRSLLL